MNKVKTQGDNENNNKNSISNITNNKNSNSNITNNKNNMRIPVPLNLEKKSSR